MKPFAPRLVVSALALLAASSSVTACKKKPAPTDSAATPGTPPPNAAFTGDFRAKIDDSDRIFGRVADGRFTKAAVRIAQVTLPKEGDGRLLDGLTATERSYPTPQGPFLVKDDTFDAWIDALSAKVPPARVGDPGMVAKLDARVPLATALAIPLLGRAEATLAATPDDPQALADGAAAAASLLLLVDDPWDRTDPLATRAIELFVRATAGAKALLPNTRAALALGLGYETMGGTYAGTSGLMAAFGTRNREALGAKTYTGEAATVLRARYDRHVEPIFGAFVAERSLADRSATVATVVERAQLSSLHARGSFAAEASIDLASALEALGKAIGPDAAPLTRASANSTSTIDALNIADALGNLPNANEHFRAEMRALAEAAIFAAVQAPVSLATIRGGGVEATLATIDERTAALVGGPSARLATPFAARLRAEWLARSGASAAAVLPSLVTARALPGRPPPAGGERETVTSEKLVDEVARASDRRPSHAPGFGHLVASQTFAAPVSAAIYAAGTRAAGIQNCYLEVATLRLQLPRMQHGKSVPGFGALAPVVSLKKLAADTRCGSGARLQAFLLASEGDPAEETALFLKNLSISAGSVTNAGEFLAPRGADLTEAVVANSWIQQYPKRVDLDAALVRDTLAKVLLRQGKFKEAKEVRAPILGVGADGPFQDAAIAEAGLGNAAAATQLLGDAERRYHRSELGRAAVAALAGDGPGVVGPLVAAKDRAFSMDITRIFTTLWRADGGDGGVPATKLVPAFFARGGGTADVNGRVRVGLFLADQLSRNPRENARTRFLTALTDPSLVHGDPMEAVNVYRALDRGLGRKEARTFLDAALPAAARRSGFAEICLVAGADDLFLDGIAPTPKTVASSDESDLLVATIALLRSGDAARVKAALAPLKTPTTHYGVAAAWMAAPIAGPIAGNPTEEQLIAYASDPRKGAEITAYLGLGFAVRGDHARAIRYLRATVRTNNTRLMEVSLAREILNVYGTYGTGALTLPPGIPAPF